MLPAARSASRSSSERRRNSRSSSWSSWCSVCSRVAHGRARSSATSASSSSVAVEPRLALPAPQRETEAARAEQRAPRSGAPTPATPEPAARRLEQDRLAVAVDVDLADLGVALAPPDAGRDVGAGSPAPCDVALSATDSPWQSTQRSSAARRRVCAASDSSPPRGHAAYAIAPNASDAEHDPRAASAAPRYPVPCAYARPSGRGPAASTGPKMRRRDDAVRPDRVRLGLAAGAEVERGLRARVEARPATRRSRPSRTSRTAFLLSSRTMPSSTTSGSSGVLRVPALQRGVLLAARDAPRVPEVHEHGLARQALGRDRLPSRPSTENAGAGLPTRRLVFHSCLRIAARR